MTICVIGAGASGMAAAISAAQSAENNVLLLERQARVGRKLLATGNGRCNLTNLGACEDSYYGAQPDFAAYALEHYCVSDTLRWFEKMGLLTVSEPSGRVYPYSDQANSVVDVLRFALQRQNITLITGEEVRRTYTYGTRFCVVTDAHKYECDRLIIACGGAAGSKLGGTMSGYTLLQGFGHTCSDLRPALVQLKANWQHLSALKGVRANCYAKITRNGEVYAASCGELQFTEYGLSGPVIFEISRGVCSDRGRWMCELDLIPQTDQKSLFAMLLAKRESNLTAEELLTGILHNRLGRVIVKEAGISSYAPIRMLEDAELERVCELIKALPIALTEPLGMDSAQVTAGGILTSEFDDRTMESKIVRGLYACGEVLDIDGACGGFNLQWAWSSGRLAGESAGKV